MTASLPWTSSTTSSSAGLPPGQRWVFTRQPALRSGSSRGSSGPVTPGAVTSTVGTLPRVRCSAVGLGDPGGALEGGQDFVAAVGREPEHSAAHTSFDVALDGCWVCFSAVHGDGQLRAAAL